MLELPTLYDQYYNRPVCLPARLACELGLANSAGEPVNEEVCTFESIVKKIICQMIAIIDAYSLAVRNLTFELKCSRHCSDMFHKHFKK